MSTIPVPKRRPRSEDNIDEAIAESFPASDPPSFSGTAGAGAPSAARPDITYRDDAAGYVAAMLAGLRQIAGKAGLDRLVTSLDAAYYDACGARDARGRDGTTAPRPAQPAKLQEKISGRMEPDRSGPH